VIQRLWNRHSRKQNVPDAFELVFEVSILTPATYLSIYFKFKESVSKVAPSLKNNCYFFFFFVYKYNTINGGVANTDKEIPEKIKSLENINPYKVNIIEII
jgi:hypothetical protein